MAHGDLTRKSDKNVQAYGHNGMDRDEINNIE
jgi:hypothetical protein